MAIGKASDFKIYQEYLHTRVNELLTQNGNVFGAASNGAIRLTTQSILGDYQYKSFFQNLGTGLAARRDTTSVSGQTDTPMTQQELISVKLNRKLIPVSQTRDAFRKIFGRFSETEFTGLVAEQAANAMQLEMLNTAIAAAAAALKGQTASYVTESSLGAISSGSLVSSLAAFGDQAQRIVCWVMHSKPYYDLVRSQINANITGISNFAIAQASPVTFNRPVIVTDSSALVSNPGLSPDVTLQYYTLGLVSDSIVVENSEEQEVVVQDVTGLENLSVRIQGEYAYNLSVKGFQWDVTSGGANPTASAVATGTNWDPAYGSVKDRAGIALNTL